MEQPGSEAEICDLVARAGAQGKTIEIVGGGTKRPVGHRSQTDIQLNTNQLTGVIDYTPSELVMSARAGTRLADINDHLNAHGQMLAFEPTDYGPLLGTAPGSTIGGVFATNLSGSRRLSAGAARDALLGVRFINGKGQAIKTGGKVMKNVTGLDMVKLMAGAWGTLGIMTGVTFKVLPKPETVTSLVIHGLDDEMATKAMVKAMAQTVDVASCAHLPASVTSATSADLGSDAATCFRLEGLAASVKIRADKLKHALRDFGEISALDAKSSASLWLDIARAKPFHDDQDALLWKISVPPTMGQQLVRAVQNICDIKVLYDWQGGLIWLSHSYTADASGMIRKTAKHLGGYATLLRAPLAVRQSVPTFEPQAKPVAALSERIKAEIDPNMIFDPGRMLFHQGPETREAV